MGNPVLISGFFVLFSVTYVASFNLTTPVDFSKADVQEKHVTFYRWNYGPDGEFLIELPKNETKKRPIPPLNPVVVLIHGWKGSRNDTWYPLISKEYFDKKPTTFIWVDWSVTADLDYDVSAGSVKKIGEIIGDYIIALQEGTGEKYLDFHVHGFSLGGHIAGFVGKHVFGKTGRRLSRITGLDPANAKFEHPDVPKGNVLNEDDADFVDVVHTDAGHFSFVAPVGHVDYYPNGGFPHQPGCPGETDFLEVCSHDKAFIYFAKSIRTEEIKAKKCSSWMDFKAGKCANEEDVVFGENVDRKARGSFYLEITDTAS